MTPDPLRIAPIEFKGQDAIRLSTDEGASAIILLYGAQVVSWLPAGGREQIHLSERARFEDGQAIRGGVPVIFPQFERWGPDQQVPRHGFARTRRWRLAAPLPRGAGEPVSVQFELHEDAESRALWPHRFELRLTVSLEAQGLAIGLEVRHPDGHDAPLAFTAALHSYLQVAHLDALRITGLSGLTRRDAVAIATGVPAAAPPGPDGLRIVGEIDQAYFDVPGPVRLRERDADGRVRADGVRLDLRQEGFADVVIWNPGPDKAAQLSDLPPDGERAFVCVEAAQIGRPVALAPGAVWHGRQILSIPEEQDDE